MASNSYVYLAIAGDFTSKKLAHATMADDPDELRQINQAIESAHELWKSWALAGSGEVLSIEGDHLRIRIPTEKLKDVADLRRRYSDILGAPVSIGFGTKLSEADQALKAAKQRGGDQILMFSPQIQELLAEKEGLRKAAKPASIAELRQQLEAKKARIKDLAQTTSGSAWKTPSGVVVVGLDPHDRTQWRATLVTEAGEPNGHNVAPDHEEALKLALGAGADIMGEPLKVLKKGEEGDLLPLLKEEPPLNSPAAGGGMTGPHENAPAAPMAPTNEADEHSENEALRSAIMEGQGEGKMGSPDSSSSPDLHELLGQIATQQGQKDQNNQQAEQAQAQSAGDQDKMRQQVIAILKVFKDRSQELEGLQQQDPELYQSLTGMLQIMTELAKEYFAATGPSQQDAQMVKSELQKGWPKNEKENQVNAEVDAVLKDKLMGEGMTHDAPTVPYKNPIKLVGKGGRATAVRIVEARDTNRVAVNPRTQPRGIARREVKRPWSQSDHARILAASAANTDVDSTARFDSLASLPTAVNSQFQIPSFSFQPLGGTRPHAYSFSHYEIPLDYPHEIIHGAAGEGRAFEYKLERGVPYIEVHGPRPGLIKLHPDRVERVYGGFPEDLQRHVFQHTETLRDAMNPQSKTPMIGESGPVAHSVAKAPNAAEMRAAAKKLGKAWPRNEQENQANAASHAVMEDAILEQGGKKQPVVHKPPLARSVVMFGQPGFFEAHAANVATESASRDRLAEHYGRQDFHYPIEPHDSWRNDDFADYHTPHLEAVTNSKRNDAEYWRHVGVAADLDAKTGLRASPATQIPTKTEMQSAWKRSPVFNKKLQKKDLMPGGKGDNKPDSAFDQEQLAAGAKLEAEEHGLDPARALEIAKDHLTEDPNYYKTTLDKAALEAGTTGRHKVNYPVGTQIDGSPSGNHEAGEVKVQDPETGLTKWRSVRAGMVMAPDGTKTSSRNPGGSSGERQ